MMLAHVRAALVAAGYDVSEIAFEDANAGAKHSTEKVAGLKALTSLTARFGDGSVRRFLLKTVREDGHRVKEAEGIIALYRQGRFDVNTSRLWLFDTFDSATGTGIGEPRELVLLEPFRDAPLLADILKLESHVAGACGTAIGCAVGDFLLRRHTRVAMALDQYIRELVGGCFGLIATLDAYPAGVLTREERQSALDLGIRWVDRLTRGAATNIHGDFHPWNVFVDLETHQVEVTGGLHTSYGLAEDDLACMALNLYLAGATAVLDGLLSKRGLESELFGFFLGWRLLIVANPMHYPLRSTIERRRLVRAALFALAGERLPTQLPDLLGLVLGPKDPWIRLDITTDSRQSGPERELPSAAPRLTRSADLSSQLGKTIEAHGRILTLRKMKQTVFADLEVDGRIQVVIPRRLLATASNISLHSSDLLGVRGQVGATASGELSVLAEEIITWRPCLLAAEQARTALEGRPLYEALAGLLQRVRQYLERNGFRELTTNVLRPSFEGGRARPFDTWSHAAERRAYLRVTSELALKGAVARGLERVYEIGPMFRNEAEDGRHLPEFLMLEAYAAYMNLDEALTMITGLLRAVGETDWLTSSRRVDLFEAFRIDIGLDLAEEGALSRFCEEKGIALRDDADSRVGAIHSILRHQVAPLTKGLLIIEGLPEGRSPLSRATGQTYSRAWIFIDGISVADVAVEEGALEVVRCKLAQQFEQDQYAVDRDYRRFLETLALGVPPCIGIGMSLSRLIQVLQGFASIRNTRLPS